MHRRVQSATLAAVILAVVLLGLPLAVGAVVLENAQARSSAASRAEVVLASVDALVLAGTGNGADAPGEQQVRAAMRAGAGAARWPQQVSVTLPGAPAVSSGAGGDDAEAAGAATTDVGVAATSVAADGTRVRVVVPRSALLGADVRLLALVAALAAGAVAAGWAVALVATRRLTEPLAVLARRAEQLGSGQVPPSAGHSGVEEVDQVARALARSGQRLAARLAAEREFASDVSHQLRTPLTALSMRLEEIESASTQPEVAAEAATALTQVERLTGVVADLLARARARPTGPPAPLALDDVLVQQQQEWSPPFARAGRSLVVEPRVEGARAWVLCGPGPLSQALATVVENSLVHGAGTTTVRTRSEGEWVVVEVRDAGPGVPPEVARHVFERSFSTASRSGLGLALARDLLVAEGGRLELVQARPATFALFLPAAPPGGG